MIRIGITAQVFEAIAATLPLGSGGYERERAVDGTALIWLDQRAGDKLKAARQPGGLFREDHQAGGGSRQP
jgi:hypothetical protein